MLVASSLHIAYFSAAALAAPGIVPLCPGSRQDATFADPNKMEFTTIISSSLENIRKVLPGDHKLVPASMAAFWRLYAVQGMAKKLQSALSAQVELRAAQILTNGPATSRADRQRLASCASRNAGAWITVVPTSSEVRLSDTEYRQAMRLRLGLPVAEGLPVRCFCDADMRRDSSHYYSCGQLKRSAITTRHDRVVQCLAGLFRSAGAVVHVEQRIEGTSRHRPDLLIITPDKSVFVDVAIIHSSAPSRSTISVEAATGAMEADKKAKYLPLAQLQGASLLAFVMDSYGSWGKQAVEVLGLLKELEVEKLSRVLAAQTLAVALQRGNALVARAGALRSRAAANRRGAH